MITFQEYVIAFQETVYMTFLTTIITFVIGLLLGILLFKTSYAKNRSIRLLNGLLSGLINVLRSIPFVILIILLIPFTRLMLGTMLGPTAAIPALVVGASPFYARLVDLALKEVDKGVIEASRAMGCNERQIILKVLIPEALPAILSGITVTAIMLVGYTALAGLIGAGGLGDLAYFSGFQRGRNEITLIATLIILAIVFVIQLTSDFIIKRIDKR